VTSAATIREARLRAGLSQRELAARLGRPQSSIARWESGARRPSLETLVSVVRACGLDLSLRLYEQDTSQDAFIWELLDLPAPERLRRQLGAAEGVRRLLPVRAEGERAGFDPVAVLRTLADCGVRYVLLGRLAEALRGSPSLPLEAEVAISAATSPVDEERLAAALDALDAAAQREHDPTGRKPFRDADRWRIGEAGATLAVVSRPPGTHGFDDLVRHASLERLVEDLAVPVASLLDLIRIADASPWPPDAMALPSLQRTSELTRDYRPPGQRSVEVPEGLEELFAKHGVGGA
jgi:transcriptional regulator with XRE-family HTH domain